jgi:hypothetical protein
MGALTCGVAGGFFGGLLFAVTESSTNQYNPLAGLRALGLSGAIALGAAFGIVGGIAFAQARSDIYHVSLASAQLAIRWRTPVRLMRFLDDAHSRNVLRTVGPSYQFRHARLQDRLAPAAEPPDPTILTPAGTASRPHWLCRWIRTAPCKREWAARDVQSGQATATVSQVIKTDGDQDRSLPG